jgi:hypothetical protein
MMTTTSHAAPFLREKFVNRVRNAHAARTQRERKAEFAAAYAYYDALSILTRSADTAAAVADAVGLPDHFGFDRGDEERVRAFLGDVEYAVFAAGAGLA